MNSIWLILSGIVLISLFLTALFWRKGFLKVFHEPYEAVGPSAMGRFGEERAIFKLNKILEAEIPRWMAKPPLSYAICFLIVCIGIGIITLVIKAF